MLNIFLGSFVIICYLGYIIIQYSYSLAMIHILYHTNILLFTMLTEEPWKENNKNLAMGLIYIGGSLSPTRRLPLQVLMLETSTPNSLECWNPSGGYYFNHANGRYFFCKIWPPRGLVFVSIDWLVVQQITVVIFSFVRFSFNHATCTYYVWHKVLIYHLKLKL